MKSMKNQWKIHEKSMKNQWNPWKIYEILQKSMRSVWNPKEINEKSLKSDRNQLEIDEIQQKSMSNQWNPIEINKKSMKSDRNQECHMMINVFLKKPNLFAWIRPHILYVEPEGGKPSALYQNPWSTRFRAFSTSYEKTLFYKKP